MNEITKIRDNSLSAASMNRRRETASRGNSLGDVSEPMATLYHGGRMGKIREGIVLRALHAGIDVRTYTLERLVDEIEHTGSHLVEALSRGNKVLVFGNGGSASQAQHLASELLGRFHRERTPLPALALTADSATLTCIGNDYGYEETFARQIRGLARPGDVVIGITTSGRSANVLKGLEAGRETGAMTIALIGHADGSQEVEAEHVLAVSSEETARVQEEHLAIIHCWCEIIDGAFAD